MKFKDCKVADALLVLPIACKYEVEKFITKCVEILKPTKLDENVCLALNLALYYNCENLIKYIIDDFLVKKYLIQKIFYVEKFCFLLEPEAVSALLSKVKIDSYLIERVIKWGQNFLEEKSKDMDLKDLFTAYSIDDYIKLENFENVASILSFYDSARGGNFFSPSEILQYLKSSRDYLSEWVHVKVEETLTEVFVVDSECSLSLNSFDLNIRKHKVIFYECANDADDLMISWDLKLNKLGCMREYCSMETETYVNMDELCSDDKDGSSFTICDTILNDAKGNLTIKINYTFWHDCRILKTSFRPSGVGAKLFKKDSKELYFTKDITIEKRKKKAM